SKPWKSFNVWTIYRSFDTGFNNSQYGFTHYRNSRYLFCYVKNKFSNQAITCAYPRTDMLELSYMRDFTLDNYIIAAAQIIYMIRIGIQIAKLLDQMKGRIAIAIAFQNILLILLAFVMVLFIATVSHHQVNELFLGAAPGGMSQIVLVAIETG